MEASSWQSKSLQTKTDIQDGRYNTEGYTFHPSPEGSEHHGRSKYMKTYHSQIQTKSVLNPGKENNISSVCCVEHLFVFKLNTPPCEIKREKSIKPAAVQRGSMAWSLFHHPSILRIARYFNDWLTILDAVSPVPYLYAFCVSVAGF